jgi:hypothetical protein
MTLAVASEVMAQSMTEKQREAFRAAKTARVVVRQSYPNAPGINLPFDETTRGLLKHLGLSLPQADGSADITFKIEASGWANSRPYQRRGGSISLYTGASVSGNITTIAQGVEPYIKSFRGEVKPPQTILG